jgi:hypothetical protein
VSLAYEGSDQGGIPRTGTVGTDDPIMVIRRFWPHGWITLRITNQQGEVIGVIGKRKGRRCWAVVYTDDPGEAT